MSADRAKLSPGQPRAEDATTAELIDRLSHFHGPPGEFLGNLLAVQCRLAAASGGAVLRAGSADRLEVIAMFPAPADGAAAPVWLAQAAESAGKIISSGAPGVMPLHGPDDLYGQPAARHLVMIPLKGSQGIRGLAAFVLETADPAALAASRERLELTVSLLSLYEMQLALERRQADLRRLRTATEVLAAVNQQERFAGAAMALCNEVAARWKCDRVSLGFLKGRYVQLKAMSHTEKFSRKMKVVQDIEAAMEECIDQDVEVACPPAQEARYVARCAEALSKCYGPTVVLSLPLRKSGEPIGVLTAERPVDAAMGLDEVEPLRLACDLCTVRLANLHEQDRWFGAKAAGGARKALAFAVGAKHTWLKAAAMLVFGAVLFMVLAKGEYQVGASYVLQAMERQIVSAPFKSTIESVDVAPSQEVVAGKILARMDAIKLKDELARAEAQRKVSITQAEDARANRKANEAAIADAEKKKWEAEISLLEYQKGQADLKAKISGHVVTHKLEHRVGAEVQTGDVLFEIAPLVSLRADLLVPEDQIADVSKGQEGELADPSSPNRRARFVVESINPQAEVVKGQNVIKVRVRLLETRPWMKLGLEGKAKVSVDRRPHIELWTRRLVNWFRMKLWLWF
ncbi:MAG TPA: HlyD family efflux transporter periplasmic adaptor subunit [Phycisphaerae bacterium]|nr:HlyD family efflux transporter periplasmic adaptor subunit [Phycisphaerae bacterium]